jgi:hypothetical protein
LGSAREGFYGNIASYVAFASFALRASSGSLFAFHFQDDIG